MNRRKFIRTTGLSLASLLVYKPFYSSQKSEEANFINYPDNVSAILDQQRVKLTRKGNNIWEYQNLIVNLKNSGEGILVFVQSPELELNSISLHWEISIDLENKVLNDHWERTYGDVCWHNLKEPKILPWYFMECNGHVTNGFGVKTGCKSFCFWQLSGERVSLTMDTNSGGKGVILKDRILEAAEIVTLQGSYGETSFNTAKKFMNLMCNHVRMPKQPVYGINDWYFCYGNNSENLIITQTELMSALCENNDNRPFSVIDDGWFVDNDVSTPNSKFSDMAEVAEAISKRGMRPGIWTRPLIIDNGKLESSLLLPDVGRTNKKLIIDPTIPENIETIKKYFRLYNQWGYELVKFDFTSFDLFGQWGYQMLNNNSITSTGWSFYDTSITNAEIILKLYKAIRNAAEETYIIGCNTFSHLSAGLFELNRIGDDTSGKEWERTLKMGVNALAFRGIHHGAFYSADADCVGLTTKVSWDKNRQWMELVAKSGTPLFISAQPEAIGKEQKESIKRCFRLASQEQDIGEPIDWMENPTPQRWKFGEEVVQFNWD